MVSSWIQCYFLRVLTFLSKLVDPSDTVDDCHASISSAAFFPQVTMINFVPPPHTPATFSDVATIPLIFFILKKTLPFVCFLYSHASF